MSAPAAGTSGWTFAQKAIVVVAGIHLLWAFAGFIAEPSFHTGADAPTEKVLGIDFNGWHAAAGLLLFGPAFLFALRPEWALFYALYAALALIVTGIWALWENQVAVVFTFPNNETDAIFHLVTGGIFLVIALIQVLIQRPQRASA